jgi:hypothetical protein
MARDLRLLPRRQVGVDLGKRLRRLPFELGDFLADRDGIAAVAERS